jgi:transmembrane sensor
MDYSKIDNYLSNNATEEEVLSLFQWIEASPENKILFIQYKKAWALTATSTGSSELVWKQVRNEIHKKKRRSLFLNVFKYAAFFIGLICIGYLYQNDNSSPHKLKIKDNAITIQLDNGTIEVLTPTGEKEIINKNGKLVGIQRGNELNYTSESQSEKTVRSNQNIENTEILAYNELNIPYGKTFQVVLSDGTKVHLNAGSSLKYPVQFIEGSNRQVFLKGEAYFDVAKDAKHPFIVNVNEMNLRVLGTKFNVSSYPEDQDYNTVLVEGSVGIYKKEEAFSLEKAILLKPGFKAKWNKKSKEVLLDKVDTDIYTGWISGKVIFKDTPFKSIRKKLERHYNVTIVNNNKVLDEKTYNATFDIETIEQVLEIFKKSFDINYKIENNKIIIN